jgi:hypothetical protein
VKRWEFERAVLASDLPAPARLVLLTLAVLANWPGGRVPAQYGPSLTRLAELSGLSRRSVVNHLDAVEKTRQSDGWVTRSRPTVADARSKKERTQYQLSIPSGAARAPETDVPGPLASAAVAPELVQEVHQASAGGAPALVHLLHRASAGGAHNQVLSKSSSSSSSNARVQTRISEALDVEEEEANQIYNRILAERSPNAPSKYVDHLIETGDIRRFRTETKPAVVYAGTRCEFVDPADGTGLCATCHMPKPHAKHGAAA